MKNSEMWATTGGSLVASTPAVRARDRVADKPTQSRGDLLLVPRLPASGLSPSTPVRLTLTVDVPLPMAHAFDSEMSVSAMCNI